MKGRTNVVCIKTERVRRALLSAQRCLNEIPRADESTADALRRAAARYRDLADQIQRGAA